LGRAQEQGSNLIFWARELALEFRDFNLFLIEGRGNSAYRSVQPTNQRSGGVNDLVRMFEK
jgi:hypothetical protein